MSMTSSDSAPTVDIEQLRRQHQDLLRDNLTKRAPPERCQQFTQQLIEAGRGTAPGRDREALRKMLYFWTADAVSRGDLSRDAPLPELAAYSGAGTPERQDTFSGLDSSFFTENIEAAPDTRATIRIAGLARQWLVAGRNPGYLLSGAALQEAKKYADSDLDIRAFVDAGEISAARTRGRLWQLSAFALAMSFLIVVGGIWYVMRINANLMIAIQDAETARNRENQQTSDQALAAVVALNAGGPESVTSLKNLLQRLANVPASAFDRLKVDTSAGLTSVTSLENTVAPAEVAQKTITPTADSTCKGVLWLGNDSDKLITNSGPLSGLQSGTTITVRSGSDVRLRSGMPLPGYVMAPQIGIVPGGASLPLTGKPEVHRSSSATAMDQYFAPVTAPQQYCTRIFVQYTANVAKAQSLRSNLLGQGFQVPPSQEIKSAAKTAEVRVFRREDLPMANFIATSLGSFNADKPLAVRELFDFPNKPAPGTIEVWIDLGA